MESSSQPPKYQRWQTFEEILQRLHKEGIYIHSEQLAEFMLWHGLPVHLSYVPNHLQLKAIKINHNYRGDMACLIEELEPPCWDYSWMENVQMPEIRHNLSTQEYLLAEMEQPEWNDSWLS